MQIPWSNLTCIWNILGYILWVSAGRSLLPNRCSVKEWKIIQWRKEPCECWVRRRFGWSRKTFIFMSLFLTVSESLCSELLMKKGMELGVYKDEWGLSSDQSEACDEEWGQDDVNKGTVECGRKIAAASQKDFKQLRSFISWCSQTAGLCRICAWQTGGNRDQETHRSTAMDMGGFWIPSSIWKFLPTKFGVCTGRKERRKKYSSFSSILITYKLWEHTFSIPVTNVESNLGHMVYSLGLTHADRILKMLCKIESP